MLAAPELDKEEGRRLGGEDQEGEGLALTPAS